MMTSFGWLGGVAVALAVSAAARDTGAPGARDSKTNGTPNAVRGLASREKAADQLSNSFDAGDSYSTPAGKRRLLRLAGSVAIQVKPGTQARGSLNELSSVNGPLKSYTGRAEPASGLTLLQAPRDERERQARDPRALRDTLSKVRRSSAIATANPVFIDPDTGLARVMTGEILIALRAGTDARNYFGSDWTNVRPLRGASDQFLLNRPGATAEALFAEASRRATDRRVAWAQPNFLSQVIKQTADPLFAAQWALNNAGLNGAVTNADVNAPEAWATTVGNAAIVIAVIDDGVEISHPDLAANIFSNPGETSNGADDDGNGYNDDLRGWDFFSDDNDPTPELPEDRHGTALAGLAAAVGDNSVGIAGAAHACRVMPVKVLSGDQWATDSGLAESIYYSAGRTRNGLGAWRGADVISIGLSFPQSAVVDAALQWAATSGRAGKGCPIFVAAGDEASRWRPTRVRLPVGALTGPGTFRFGFEYSKDVSMSVGEDLVRIDNVALLAGDGVTHVNSALGPNGRQDFEGAFPPAGWERSSSLFSPLWFASTSGALSGSGGSTSAQSGTLSNGNWTELRTPAVAVAADTILSFSCYVSSETDYDGLKVWAYDADGDYVNVFAGESDAPYLSGNPTLAPSIRYPASHPAVIAVGASTDADRRADYSAYGPGLELLAPSSGGWNDIVATDLTGTDGYGPGDYVSEFGGTSAACPLAAGVAALMLSVDPTMTAADVRGLLRESSDKIGGVPYDGNGWNQLYGYGRLNAQSAVVAARSFASSNLRLTINASPLPAGVGAPLTYSLTVSNRASSAATGVVVTNVLPGGVNFVSSTPSVPLSGGMLVFNLGNLPAGGAAGISIVVTPQAVGSYTNTATVASSTTDPNSTSLAVAVVPSVSISDGSVTEGNSGTLNAVFSLRLSERSSVPVSVNFSLADGSAVGGLDYVPVYGTVVFPPGSTNQLVRVPVVGDLLSESNLTFFVMLDGAVNAGISRGTALGTIIDNRDPIPAIRIEDLTVTEGDGGMLNAVFAVRLSRRSGKTVTVQYSTANGTAMGNSDFITTIGTVTFAPGIINETIAIAVIGDTLNEANETFFIDLANPVNGTISRRRARGTVLDNDPVPLVRIDNVAIVEGHTGTTNAMFTVSLSAPSSKLITVSYATASGSATAGRDFRAVSGTLRFAAGTTNLTVNVPVIGETLSESNESFFVNLTRAVNANIVTAQGVGTILDDDVLPGLSINDARGTELNAGARNMVFTMRLAVPSGRTVTVDYSTADGTAVAGSDYVATNGTVTFPPGSVLQTLRVPVIGNRISESNEVFLVYLGNPVNATLVDDLAIGTILDNDRVPALSINDVTVAEGSAATTNAVFTVRLSAPSGRTVTVGFITSNNTARAGTDFHAASGIVTFPPDSTNQPITVAVINDALVESTETFFIKLTGAANATVADGHGVGTILDNDVVPTASIRPAASVVGTNHLSDFRITSARVDGSNVVITFPTFAGRSIRLEYTDGSLSATNVWLPVPGATDITGGGESRTVTHVGGASHTVRFYRGRLSP